tara:strand:+ start:540 stop:1373 length:834 start_codon:yes stop_codon:yes gene_type:complete
MLDKHHRNLSLRKVWLKKRGSSKNPLNLVVDFLRKTYEIVFDFGLGRRINMSAVKKISVPNIGIQIFLNVLGGLLISVGATMIILADVGATTTDVLLTGISKQTGLSIAGASFGLLATLMVLLGSIRAKIGIGTLVIPISVSTTFLFSFSLIPDPHNFGAQLLYFLSGLVTIALGVGVGASAGIGMGAYESICHRIAEVKAWHPQVIRLCWELIILTIGILLGGAFGIGTLIAAVATGWILKYMNSVIGDYLLGRRIRTNCKTPLARGYEYDHLKKR